MGVSGQLQAPAAPRTHWTEGWVGPRARLDTEATGKIILPLLGTEPQSPGSLIRKQTLQRLSYPDMQGRTLRKVPCMKGNYWYATISSRSNVNKVRTFMLQAVLNCMFCTQPTVTVSKLVMQGLQTKQQEDTKANRGTSHNKNSRPTTLPLWSTKPSK
jgi:hypothetical protein